MGAIDAERLEQALVAWVDAFNGAWRALGNHAPEGDPQGGGSSAWRSLA